MSRSTKSASRSQSRSRSRSRSRSTSHSRSRSRSRSRKRYYRSRSRSKSRSYSPSNNREKKYPRGYQDSREFRGYHRGFRRPYNFRGRGRGYFPRGRFQRGGRGGGYNNNNNNFRPNWKNYKQHPQKQQQQQQQQNYARGRSHNVQKRSGSPSRGHSHRSDHSSSPLSRHSQHSSSSSHSSSPKSRPVLLLSKQEELSAFKEVQKEGGGDGEPEELVGVLAGDANGGGGSGKTEGNWQSLTDCNSSPKRTSPLANAAVVVSQSVQTTNQSSSSPKITNSVSNGAPSPKMTCSSSPTKKTSHEGLNPMLSSFDFFSSEEYLDGDKTAISIAFGKFLEEQNKKAKAWENCKKAEANEVDMEQGKVNGKASMTITDQVSRKSIEDNDGEVSLRSFLKASPFVSAEEDEERIIKPHSKSLDKDQHNGDKSSKPSSRVTHSARELFDECFDKWHNVAYAQSANSDLDSMAEDMYLSKKQDKTAAFAAALAKRESGGKFEAPDTGATSSKMGKSSLMPTPSPPSRRNSEREMFLIRGDDMAFISPRKQEAKFNVRMDFHGDSLISSSDFLAEERQLSQDLVQASKKDQEFRSIFQHVHTTQLPRSPSELFAQHIVAIVHHVKTQHFQSSGMTLNERFTVYQRRAAEKEIMKPRKSPEIHRRIDVSPRAFKKHAQVFEAMKSSEDGTYKDAGEKKKGDPMDLRLDIERRKKYSTHERDHNLDRGRNMEESPDSSKDRSLEKFSTYHDRSKKNRKKRSRSSSSSSSSSSKSHKEDLPQNKSDTNNKGFDRTRLGQRESSPGPVERGRPRGGFQVRIRGRGWNRGSYQGNCSHSSNISNMEVHQKNEDWDPEFTPKSRKYYLHDDRDSESELKWADSRGRGRGGFTRGRARFIIRKATGGPNIISPKWAHDKFQANGEPDGEQEDETEQDHKGGRIDE